MKNIIPGLQPRLTVGNKYKVIISLFVLILSAIIGLILYQISLIKNDMAQLIEVEEPLEEAILEMEINIGEATLAVLDYVRELESEHLERITDSEDDFEQNATVFARLAETGKERVIGRQLDKLYREYKGLADKIVSLANQRDAALRLFRQDVIAIDELIDKELQSHFSKTGPEAIQKLEAALEMEINIGEAFAAIEGYILLAELELLQTLGDAETDFKHFEGMYWQTSLIAEEREILEQINENFAEAVITGKQIIAIVDKLAGHLNKLKENQLAIDVILDDTVQPLINKETVRVSEDAKLSANKASMVTLIGGIMGIVIGSLLIASLGRSHKALLVAKQKIERILDSAGEGIYGVDSEGRVTFVNPAAARNMGWDRQELLGQMQHDIMHHTKPNGSPYPIEECPIYLSLQDGKEYKVVDEVFWRKDGTSFPVKYVSAPIWEQDTITGAVIVFSDISEQKRVYEEIHKLSQSVENSPTIVIITDKDSTIEYVNPVFVEITGYTEEDAIGAQLNTFVAGELSRKTAEKAWNNVRLGEKWRGEVLNKKKNGDSYWADQIIFPILNDNGDITHVVSLQDDITELKKHSEQLCYLATHDQLTGLPNRSQLLQRLDEAIKTACRRKCKFALFFLDLDGFKEVNDRLGHGAGDELLKIIGKRLQMVLREIDFAGRLGGDEFCVIIDEITDAYHAAQVADRCLTGIMEPVVIAGCKLVPRVSIGITLFPDDGQEQEALLRAADSAMYAAKQAGKHQYAFYTPELTYLAEQRLSLENDLRRAFEKEEFELYYQPQVSMANGRMSAVEALIRWRHPERGFVQPGEFIEVIERIGLISELGEWVLRTACQQVITWRQAGVPSFRMAVNISSTHFQQGEIVQTVKSLLEETGLEPAALELEITEAVVQATEESIESFRQLKELGITIAIDDFGTGYSSLGSLKHLPIDCLKVDRLFIQDVLTEKGSSAIIAAVIAMGQALGLSVIAEGVETNEQVEYLSRVGCDSIQGFYFSRPVPADRIPELATIEFYHNVCSSG